MTPLASLLTSLNQIATFEGRTPCSGSLEEARDFIKKGLQLEAASNRGHEARLIPYKITRGNSLVL